MNEVAIGIDLGTTNSVIARFEEGGVRVLENRQGELMTPSTVALDPDGGGLLIGRPARELLALHPGRAVGAFKRAMGSDEQFSLDMRQHGAVELSACILRALREDAARTLGTEVTGCVITVPAYFNEEQRFATMKAGELAGLNVMRILNEPTAAAIAYGLHRLDKESKFLVFDLGGGTFDVCIMELFEGILQVLSTAGASRLGGEDFTRRLVSWTLREVGTSFEQAELRDIAALGQLYKRCEMAKRKLSDQEDVEVIVPRFMDLLDRDVSVRMMREDAETAWEPLLRDLAGPTRSALMGAKLDPSDLDEIILVGGATRMPAVRRFVESFFGRQPVESIDPDLTVAHGAAIQAALCLQDAAVEEIVVTDVVSHSLGVDVAREIAGRPVTGYFSPVIHRNTVIPTSRTEDYYTLHTNQRAMRFGIYEGDARRVEDNRHIGTLDVNGIPKGPAGQQVDVTFTYDVNGLLEVEATIAGTAKKFSRIFSRESKTLSKKALDAAAGRMSKLKADPLKNPRYRDLKLRAESLWKDAPESMRAALDFALISFDEALMTRNAMSIRKAFEALEKECDRFDGGERW